MRKYHDFNKYPKELHYNFYYYPSAIVVIAKYLKPEFIKPFKENTNLSILINTGLNYARMLCTKANKDNSMNLTKGMIKHYKEESKYWKIGEKKHTTCILSIENQKMLKRIKFYTKLTIPEIITPLIITGFKINLFGLTNFNSKNIFVERIENDLHNSISSNVNINTNIY